MKRPVLVLVGGFLGAGKTTLLLAAARHLRSRGLRAGFITNDQDSEIPIAHLKVFDRAATGHVKASLTRNQDKPLVEGDLLASPCRAHHLTLNLRARAHPALLEETAGKIVVKQFGGELTVHHKRFLQPSPPVPQHRFQTVI